MEKLKGTEKSPRIKEISVTGWFAQEEESWLRSRREKRSIKFFDNETQKANDQIPTAHIYTRPIKLRFRPRPWFATEFFSDLDGERKKKRREREREREK